MDTAQPPVDPVQGDAVPLAAQDRLMAPLSDHEREVFKDMLARIIRANAVNVSHDGGRQS